jgi:hypothetical protein
MKASRIRVEIIPDPQHWVPVAHTLEMLRFRSGSYTAQLHINRGRVQITDLNLKLDKQSGTSFTKGNGKAQICTYVLCWDGSQTPIFLFQITKLILFLSEKKLYKRVVRFRE